MFLIDDLAARPIVRTDASLSAGIQALLGTVGLILLAKRAKRIEKVRPILDALRQETFRLDTRLYEEALQAAGEWPPR